MLRWKSFVQSEDNAFVAVVDAFTKATGVKVTVSRESIDDVQPKASVAANTGSGPDLFWGYYSLPHLFPKKCVDLTDVADYLGKKYGGWVPSAIIYGTGTGNKWIDIPICYTGVSINYRISSLKKAGFSNFPSGRTPSNRAAGRPKYGPSRTTEGMHFTKCASICLAPFPAWYRMP
jgi:multiple sugar transport system substrate-binding protein